tara:strand:+ start:1191 stop:1634 length:444 start_codon:yes stop_codon:yes gene_type:complete
MKKGSEILENITDTNNTRGISFNDLKEKSLKISEYFFDDLFIYDIAKFVMYCDGCRTSVGTDFIIFKKLLPEGPAIIPAIVISAFFKIDEKRFLRKDDLIEFDIEESEKMNCLNVKKGFIKAENIFKFKSLEVALNSYKCNITDLKK